MPEPVFKKDLSLSTTLSSTIVSLSLLAGCASSPEQSLLSEAPETQAPVQIEVADALPSEANNTSTKIAANTDVTSPSEVTTEPEVAPMESEATTAPKTTVQAQPAPSSDVATETEIVTSNTATPVIAATRSENDLGNAYGIWTLKKSNNGLCKLSSPTLQTSTSNNEYSSQIWMDIEEQRIVVNAFMSMEITHPKTGIQIDDQPLIPFSEKVYSTRAVVTGNLTAELAEGNQLHIFINGKEVGQQILKRNVKLTNMSSAISALESCGE